MEKIKTKVIKTEVEEKDYELDTIRIKKSRMLQTQDSMPRTIIKLHSTEEYNELWQKYPDKIVVIDFTAVWCGPCRFYAPIFEKLQEEYYNDFIFVKVDIDEIRELAMRYQITGVPTTLFTKNGSEVNRGVGALNYNMLKQYLESLKT